MATLKDRLSLLSYEIHSPSQNCLKTQWLPLTIEKTGEVFSEQEIKDNLPNGAGVEFRNDKFRLWIKL
jgi:hypothetical protein